MSQSQIILWTLLSYIIMAGNFEEITITVIEGHNVTLPCNIESDDEALQSDLWLLYWNKTTTVAYFNFINNDTDFADTRYHVDQGETTLVISNATKTDAGIYQCKVQMSTQEGLVSGQYVNLSVTEKNSLDLPSVTTPHVPEGGGSMTGLWNLFIVPVVLFIGVVTYFIRRRNRNGRTKLLNQSLPNPAQLDTDCSERESMINHQGDGNTCSNQLNQSLPNPAQLDTDCSERESMINHQGDGNTCSNQRPSQANPAQQAIDRNGNERPSQANPAQQAIDRDGNEFPAPFDNQPAAALACEREPAHQPLARNDLTGTSLGRPIWEDIISLKNNLEHLVQQHPQIADFYRLLIKISTEKSSQWDITFTQADLGRAICTVQQNQNASVGQVTVSEEDTVESKKTYLMSHTGILERCLRFFSIMNTFLTLPENKEGFESIMSLLFQQLPAHRQKIHDQDTQASRQGYVARGGYDLSHSGILEKCLDFIIMMSTLHSAMRNSKQYEEIYNKIMDFLHHQLQVWQDICSSNTSGPQHSSKMAVSEIRHRPSSTLSKADIKQEGSDLMKMLQILQTTKAPDFAESYRIIVKCLSSQLTLWQAACMTPSETNIPEESLQIAHIQGSTFASKTIDHGSPSELFLQTLSFISMMNELYKLREFSEYAESFNTIVQILCSHVQYLRAAYHPDGSVPQDRNELPEIYEVPDTTDRD